MKKPKKKGLSAAQFLASVQLFYQSSPPVRVPFKLLSIFSKVTISIFPVISFVPSSIVDIWRIPKSSQLRMGVVKRRGPYLLKCLLLREIYFSFLPVWGSAMDIRSTPEFHSFFKRNSIDSIHKRQGSQK